MNYRGRLTSLPEEIGPDCQRSTNGNQYDSGKYFGVQSIPPSYLARLI